MEYYNNDPNFRIAIYIGGTIIRQNGYRQIVSVGALAGMEYENLDAAPISRSSTTESPVFTIKNAESYVLYKIWDDSVQISDVMNDGRLCIGMTIPAQARLSGGKSPYRLLMDIYQKFLALGTEPTADGRRKFKNEELKKEDFQDIINQYPIEYAQNRVVPMKGNRKGQLQITTDKGMEDFFRDTQYDEFADYEAIEVTKQGLNMFPSLRIPKPKGYRILVNGNLMTDASGKEKILWEGGKEPFNARCDSTLDYRYEPLQYITIDKLRNALNNTLTTQDGNSKAVLDEATLTIACTLNPIAKWYKKEIKYDLKSDDDAKRYCKENMGKNIRVLVSGQEWNDKIQPSQVAGQKENGDIVLREDRVSVSPSETDSYRFSVSKVEKDSYDGEKILVFIKAEKKKRTNERRGGNGGSSGLDWKSLLIGVVIGIAVGVAGFWEAQTLYKNHTDKKLANSEKAKEAAAWGGLKDITPKNPKQAMLFREYLRNFSNAEISISKGDSVPEKIHGSFSNANATNIGIAKGKLQKYVDDSIAAERAEEEAFKACTDTIACNNYLGAYDPVQDHQYFEKGKHVDTVLKIKSDLKAAKAAADAKDKQEKENQAKTRINNAVKTRALQYLNSKDLKGFREWLKENNGDWQTEIGGKKTNKDLLGKEKVNAVEWILDKKNKSSSVKEMDKKTALKDLVVPDTFKSWDDVMQTKQKIDNIVQ